MNYSAPNREKGKGWFLATRFWLSEWTIDEAIQSLPSFTAALRV
jgi:hypothetical protein